RLAADEVMVELDEWAVPQLVGRQVVIFDVVRDEAAADRAGGLVAAGREPLAVLLHLLAGVHGRQGRGNPARLQRVRGVGAGTHRDDAELFTGLQDRIADELALLVRPPQLQARGAGHAVPQGAYPLAANVDRVHGEELDVGNRSAVQLVEDLLRIRALHLVAVVAARDGLALRIAGGTIVTDHVDLEAAGLAVELDPAHRRRTAGDQQLILLQIEEDTVADDV